MQLCQNELLSDVVCHKPCLRNLAWVRTPLRSAGMALISKDCLVMNPAAWFSKHCKLAMEARRILLIQLREPDQVTLIKKCLVCLFIFWYLKISDSGKAEVWYMVVNDKWRFSTRNSAQHSELDTQWWNAFRLLTKSFKDFVRSLKAFHHCVWW